MSTSILFNDNQNFRFLSRVREGDTLTPERGEPMITEPGEATDAVNIPAGAAIDGDEIEDERADGT